MPRIALVITRLNKGGTAKYIESLSNELEKAGNQVRIFTGFTSYPETEDNFVRDARIVRINHLGRKFNPVADFWAWGELKRAINKYNPEIIHSHTFKAGFLVRLTNTPALRIHTFHGHSFSDPEFGMLKKILIWLTEFILRNRSNFYIVTGQEIGKQLESRQILNRNNWCSIPPKITIPAPSERAPSRQYLELPANGFVVLWMGRFAPVKQPETLISLSSAIPEINFLMVGEGELQFVDLPPNLFVRDWSPLEKLLGACDLLVNTSSSEGLSLSIIEAQLSGLPVVCFDVGSNGEIVIDGKTGFVVKNERDMWEKVRLLSEDTSLYSDLSKNSQIFAEARFTGVDFLEKHLKAYGLRQ